MIEYYEGYDNSITTDITIEKETSSTSLNSDKLINDSNNFNYDTDSIESESLYNIDSWKYIKNESVSSEAYELKKFIYKELIESELIPYTMNKIETFISDNYNEIVFYALSEVFTENMNDSELIIKIIRCLTLIPYKSINSSARLLIISALSINDRSIQQHAVEALGIWSDPKTIEILKNIDCKDKWFEKYVNKIIKGIEKNNE